MNYFTELFGYLFCEFAFRWFDFFDGTPFVGDMEGHTEKDVRCHHHLIMGVGGVSYSAGCYFYNYGETPD
jgi:hypothetical protein